MTQPFVQALISKGVDLKMDAQEVSNKEDIDSKRPGGVALAAILLMISPGAKGDVLFERLHL